MAAGGVRDILIANQIVTPKKIDRLVHLRRQIDVKVAVDNPDNVALLGGLRRQPRASNSASWSISTAA